MVSPDLNGAVRRSPSAVGVWSVVGGSTVLVGYANGYAGCLPTRAAFAEAATHPGRPAHDVLTSRVARGEPERGVAAFLG